MKTLIKMSLAGMMLISTFAAQAEWVSGHFRGNGTYVAPYYRSDAGSSFHSFPSMGSRSSVALDTTSSYVYRNPFAATPSVDVSGYYRSSGTYVAPHVRTAPNDTPTDNLSYGGSGKMRVPKSSFEW